MVVTVPDATRTSARPVAVTATVAVHLTVTADGKVVFDQDLRAGEGRQFVGDESVGIELATGGTARVTVNGKVIGTPGLAKAPYVATFYPPAQGTPSGATPSAGATTGGSPSPAPTAS